MLAMTLVSIPLVLVLIGALSLLAVGVWVIVDAFLIPGLVREHNQRLIWEIEHHG